MKTKTYFDTTALPFGPVVKVKPLAKVRDEWTSKWFIVCKVVSRKNGYYGLKYGEILERRPEALFERSGVQRGKCGRLYFADRMDIDALLSLPVED